MTPAAVLDNLLPESFGLLPEYYTPVAITASIAELRSIREEGPRLQGTVSLVIANPPYEDG